LQNEMQSLNFYQRHLKKIEQLSKKWFLYWTKFSRCHSNPNKWRTEQWWFRNSGSMEIPTTTDNA